MKDLYEKYIEKYGVAEKHVLVGFGGSLDEIIDRHESAPTLPFPVDPMLTMSDEDSIHGAVLAGIESRYFSSIKREDAISICNVLSLGIGDGTIKVDNRIDLEYNAYRFREAWNKYHNEAEKIYGPTSFEI